MKKVVAYVYNEEYLSESDKYIPTKNRNQMVHRLIEASDLLEYMTIIQPNPAKFEDLAMFHNKDFLQFLHKKAEDSDNEELEEFGLGYDCPLKPKIFEYCANIAGGSITAADTLRSKKFNIAIHWLGGWHHAKKSKASGFCYVNDCVLAILTLTKTFKKILYIDVDLHHGDGVQEAFSATNKVLTFSIHNFHSGFFPGTGAVDDIGCGKGKGFSINFPLKEGVGDDVFQQYTIKALQLIKEKFIPDVIVCQFGADGLNEDPMKSFNLTPSSFISILKYILSWNLPLLVLGGGGYHEANVARCWCLLTAALLEKELDEDIPENNFFDNYGPAFDFQVSASLRKDMNSKEYLDSIIQSITEVLTDFH